jgi:putative alpha-1,2-mannosidase
VGEAVYELFPPLFDKVTLHLGADRQTTVVIRKEGAKGSDKCKRVTWNGKRLRRWQIAAKEILQGGELVFHF